MVICFSSKDYELQSWNEQGEITKIEGMLTIAFCFIFPCSHNDGKKLYLIVKIPYGVNMSHYMTEEGIAINDIVVKKEITEEEEIQLLKEAIIDNFDGEEWKLFQPHHKKIFEEYREYKSKIKELKSKIQKVDLKDMDFGLGKGLLPVNFDKYAEWVVEVPKLKQKINEFEIKIKDLIKESKQQKDEINFLKSHLGKDETEWIIKRDLAIRTNRIPNEPNEFGFPLNFDEEKAHHLHTSEKNQNWWHFEYYYNNDFPNGKCWEYDLPFSLYDFLKERQKKSIDIYSIKDVETMKKYIYSIGEVPRGEYFTKMANFILKKRGKIFDVEELDDECKFNNRKTRRDYCKKFIKWGLIKEIKTSGKYKIIF